MLRSSAVVVSTVARRVATCSTSTSAPLATRCMASLAGAAISGGWYPHRSKEQRQPDLATGSAAEAAAVQPHHQQRRGLAFQKGFHIDTPDNNATTYFDFTPENYERVFAILAKYPEHYKQAAMIPLLDLAQRQHGGWLPLSAMNKVAQICEVAPVQVYEVASFYTMFNRTKVGKYFLQVCGTTPCMICGSEDIMNAIKSHLGIENGQTTSDGLFTLLEVECLGSCANAPMLQCNDDYYECLTPANTKAFLDACQQQGDGTTPPGYEMGKWGSLPLNGQVSCEGPQGKTSLEMPVPVPQVDPKRFADGEVDPASVKEHMAY